MAITLLPGSFLKSDLEAIDGMRKKMRSAAAAMDPVAPTITFLVFSR
jgi:hypothetical protein